MAGRRSFKDAREEELPKTPKPSSPPPHSNEKWVEAERIIIQIATDRPELSQENIRVQRNQNQIECKKWMEKYGH